MENNNNLENRAYNSLVEAGNLISLRDRTMPDEIEIVYSLNPETKRFERRERRFTLFPLEAYRPD